MGGLYPKMKITALTMLIGVLAICRHSAVQRLVQQGRHPGPGARLRHASTREHLLLFLLPLVTAGITTFYMFRMWFMTFTGKPRDEHVYEHAHESPLADDGAADRAGRLQRRASPGAGRSGTPRQSWLEHQLHHAQPDAVLADFGTSTGEARPTSGRRDGDAERRAHGCSRDHTWPAIWPWAWWRSASSSPSLLYYYRVLDPAEAQEQFPGVHRFLRHKWYFDELYSVMLVRPALVVADWCRVRSTPT